MTRVVGTIPGVAETILYLRGSKREKYQHPFEHPVKMYALSDGSVLMKGSKRIWADDSSPDFDRYVNPKEKAMQNPTRHYRVRRIEPPSHFARGSFRTITPRRGVRVTIGCPKGHWSHGRCRVGTRAQRIMYAKNPRRRRNPKSGGMGMVGWLAIGLGAYLLLSRSGGSLFAPAAPRPTFTPTSGQDLGTVAAATAIQSGIPVLTQGINTLIGDLFGTPAPAPLGVGLVIP